jgi:protein O-GlcNAc transferase
MTIDGAARAEETLRRAVLAHQQSRLEDARALYAQTLKFQPEHFLALHLSGVVALQQDQAELALQLIGRALVVDPSNVVAHVNYGTAQHLLKRFDAAVDSYDKALALMPNCAEVLYNRGNALREGGNLVAAVESYDKAIALKPDYVDAHLNGGLALSSLGHSDAAISRFNRAIALNPNNADAHYNRGNELRRLGRHEAALASYDEAIALQPGFADAHLNRGSALVGLRRHAAAVASYDKALTLRPGHAPTHFNRAGALQHLGRYEAAVSNYDAAIALQPNYAESHSNRGRALRELKRYDEAIASYGQAVILQSNSVSLLALRRHIQMQICDWRGLNADISAIHAGIARGAVAPNPFYLLALSGSPDVQQRAAASWAREETASMAPLPALTKRSRSDRIHIGYFSADYHEHATAYLIAQLLEVHDRSRFKISAFSFGPDSHGPMRRRLKTACETFVDVRDRSDDEVAWLARNSHVDIAVDLKGFTQDNRLGVFSRRAAPVQVNYLGAPGTLGAPFMDYLIADRVLIPTALRRHYSESVVFLPNSYQVNDATRAIAAKRFARAELGLPPTGFVFCCFNNSYKILPDIFQRWLNILARVPESVLWLLGDNATAVANLRRTAYGVAARTRSATTPLRRSHRPTRALGATSRRGSVHRHATLQRPHHSKRRAVGRSAGTDLHGRRFRRSSGSKPADSHRPARTHRLDTG